MNIQELQKTLVTNFTHRVAEYVDSAAYGFVVSQLEYLRYIGKDPTQYEIIFLTDECPQMTHDGMKIEKHLRLIKVPKATKIKVDFRD